MGLARATFNNPISPGIFILAILSSSPSSRHASGCVVIWSRKKIAKTRILFSFFFPNFIAKKQLRIAYLKKKDQNFILSSNHRHLDNNSFDIHQSKPRQSNRRTTLHRLLRYPPRVVSFSTLEGGKSVSLKLGRSVKSEIVGKHWMAWKKTEGRRAWKEGFRMAGCKRL